MDRLSVQQLHKIVEATQIIHAHAHGTFHERLFQAVSTVFDGTCHGFQFYAIDGSHTLESDAPFPVSKREAIGVRAGELAAAENPMYSPLINKEPDPLRLSDFISQRELHRTNLYQEVLCEADIKYQIALGVHCAGGMGGLTINRGNTDFNGSDLLTASLLSKHVAVAFESDNLLKKLSSSIEESHLIDHVELRRMGLSRRESEVMIWMVEGKRDAEIAIILDISVRTVHQHVSSIFRKLLAETRTAAVMMVIQRAADRMWKRPGA